MTTQRPTPPLWRVILALFVAPSVTALAMAYFETANDGLPDLWGRTCQSFFIYLLFGLPQALVFGAPAYLLLRKKLSPTPLSCAIAGAVVASIPWLVLSLIVPGPDDAFSGGHTTDHNGHKTLWGWLDLTMGIGELALAGLVAGFVFWMVATADTKRQTLI